MSSPIYNAGLKIGEAVASAEDGQPSQSAAALNAAASSLAGAGQPGLGQAARSLAGSAPGNAGQIANLFHGQIQPALDDKGYQVISAGWLMGRAATALRLVKAKPRDDEETRKRFMTGKRLVSEWLRGAKVHYDYLQQVHRVPPTANGPLTSAISAIDVSKSIGDLNNSAQLVENAAGQLGTAVGG